MPLSTQPAWQPTKEYIEKTNIFQAMKELKINDYKSFHRFSVEHFEEFWAYTIKKLHIQFKTPYQKICDLREGVEQPHWLAKAKFNIVDSCFTADKDATAVIYQIENSEMHKVSYGELNKLVNRIANSLITHGFQKGDAIAIDMPMNINAVAIYLAIIKMGGVVVSIADSFAPDEIATRLTIANTKAIFTQDYILRNQKKLPLYEKIVAAHGQKIIVLPAETNLTLKLRPNDLSWADFLGDNDKFTSVLCEADDPCNILFSSGTTGTPKAIVWTHTTPIKCASDAFYHQDIKLLDILAWPTNLGWMMGPWLVYASLINQSTMALFDGAPTTQTFGEFIQNAKVTMLGLVPSLVTSWRATKCMEGLNWDAIKLFSSTGECSNASDMLYLMSLAHIRPIIEYCGGTEVGGAYLTSTVVEPNAPAVFTTPTLGLDIAIIDEQGKACANGEVALIPPSIGLSNKLLNRDHYQVYYANMPKTVDGKTLRRHGDQIEKINEQYYRALGRVDDTMNLGGIKTSSAEIERVLAEITAIKETAAIAISPPEGGPSLLVLYAVLNDKTSVRKDELMQTMQQAIKKHLNPLFKVHDVIIVDDLPRTSSNKVMRRVLRERYTKHNRP
jgi:acetyl-CoA synthetase